MGMFHGLFGNQWDIRMFKIDQSKYRGSQNMGASSIARITRA
jgi:hypothetical protein